MNCYNAYNSDVETIMQINVKIATELMENRLFECVDSDTVRYAAYLVAGLRHGLVCPAFPTAQPHAPYTTFTVSSSRPLNLRPRKQTSRAPWQRSGSTLDLKTGSS